MNSEPETGLGRVPWAYITSRPLSSEEVAEINEKTKGVSSEECAAVLESYGFVRTPYNPPRPGAGMIVANNAGLHREDEDR